MATNSDVVATQMEKVRPKLQEIYETTTGVGAWIKKAAESHRISAWTQSLSNGQTLSAFRVPLQQFMGGDYGTFSYDEGDLGGGSSQKDVFMSLGYFPDRYAIQLSSLEMTATATSEQAVVNVFKNQMKGALKEMQAYYDTGLHGDGTGVLATGNGTGSPTVSGGFITYNLEANFGPQRLRYNQPVDIYNAALSALQNSGGFVRVYSYSLTAKTVTLSVPGSVTIASPVNTDRIAFNGMAPTLAVGSWRGGIYQYNSSATSGFLNGLDKSVVTELQTPNVNASSASLSPAMPLLLQDQIRQRRDDDAVNGLKGIVHQAQRAAWYFQGIGISEWFRGKADKMIDLVPADIALNTSFTMAGIEHMVSKKQDRSRVDWIIPKNWARVMLKDLDWFQGPDGQKFFVERSSTTGNPKAGFLTYLVGLENVVSCDPGAAGLISSLALPSGY